MHLLLFVSLNLSFILCVSSENIPNNVVQTKMEANKIVPDVIDKAPTEKIEISYGPIDVNLGNELTPLQVKDVPSIKYSGDEDTYYTLLMIDPDAPSRASPTVSEVRHWFVGNIKGTDWKTGEEITEYVGSGPPKGTGLHRYIFLLYKQEDRIDFDEPKTAKNSRAHRLKFKTRDFVKKYNLGNPVAGNFFQAQWDEYVEIRDKNFIN